MAIEQGTVISADAAHADMVWVEVGPPAACATCAGQSDCSGAGSGKTRKVEVVNHVGAKVGDRVHIRMKTSALLKAIFLLYLFPILCMVGGGLAGQIVSHRIGTDASISSMIAAVACFVTALVGVRTHAGRMALRSDYQPKIIRILPRQPKTNSALNTPDHCSIKAVNPK